MILRDLGSLSTPEWFHQLLAWSRRRVSFTDNLDGTFVDAQIGTGETEIGHNLGRAPTYVFELASFGTGTAGITLTRAPEAGRIFIKRAVAGKSTLFLT